MKFSLINKTRNIGFYATFLSLILLVFGTNQIFAAPVQIYLNDVFCHVETDDGPGSDEPYLLVTAVDLAPPSEDPIPIPTLQVFRYGPFDDVDAGERHFGPGIADSFWNLHNNPAEITNADNLIFIVALMENDNGHENAAAIAVKSAAAASLLSSALQDRSIIVNRLVNDIHAALEFPTGFPSTDERVEFPKELRFSSAEIAQASSGQTLQKSLTFSGDGGRYTLNFAVRNPVPPTGDLLWYKHNEADSGADEWANGDTAKKVGIGWQNFKSVFSTSDGVIYGIHPNGDLIWYRHNDWRNGMAGWANNSNGIKIGSGWQYFKFVFATNGGVIYAVQSNGDLIWYKHNGWETGAATWANGGSGVKIGSGWQHFTTVFASSNGVIYGIQPGGDLLWYKHRGWQNGSSTWENNGNSRRVGSSWQGFRSVFATNSGIIYGVQNNGDLMWYWHNGWETGVGTWSNAGVGIRVGGDWQKFKSVFATKTTPISGYYGDESVIYGIHPAN